MKTAIEWIDQIPERNGVKSVVNAITFRPDGSQMVLGVGDRVLVYNPVDGNLLNSLKGHKDTVYTVDYAKNGKRFASGGADNVVIIWTHKAEGILKYTHAESIQCVAYNPVTQALASCTASDFGMWSPEQKSVVKTKVVSKILSASWSNDGQYIALGMFNGHITIRDKQGEEKVLIERSAPVWCLSWNPSKNEASEVLAVGCWDKTLSFYHLSGLQQGKDRKLSFMPCSLSFYQDGQYILMGGSNRRAHLYTKEGIRLAEINSPSLEVEEDEVDHGWIWCVKGNPKHNDVIIGFNDGTVINYRMTLGTVHGIFQERYAYRENMTDVIVQHLMTEQKVRIKTRDLVKKIALYRDRLAIQLGDRLIIYEIAHENAYDMHYHVKERINQSFDCNLLVVTSMHFVLCHDKTLIQYNFSGKKEREWNVESTIRYIKLIGGAAGREGILLGLKNGCIYQIFINNPFPILLLNPESSSLTSKLSAIRCLDISADRTKIAMVDDTATCYVYDLVAKEITFQQANANSVAWNSECNEMLCFSGNGQLYIKTGEFPPHLQRMSGFVVGFSGSKVFCLHNLKIQAIDVPQSAPLYRYLEEKKYDLAYSVACLGVTESDWTLLAMESLKNMEFTISRKAFIRVRDMRYIDLLNYLEQQIQNKKGNPETYLAEILAYQGRFTEAAKLFSKNGLNEKAIGMFTDLRMWEEAKQFAKESGVVNVADLVKHQAEWAAQAHDWRAAAEMYRASGDYSKAIQIIGDQKWYGELMELGRQLDGREHTKPLTLCAKYLYDAGQFQYCRDIYLKIGDIESLMKLHIQLEEWDEAVRLAKKYEGRFPKSVFLPYAEWLANRDLFDKALEAYKNADRPDQCIHLLQQLAENSVVEQRYKDTSFYFFRLSEEHFQLQSTLSIKDENLLTQAYEYAKQADLYYAYSFIFSFTDDPFTSIAPETLFNASRYLMNVIGRNEAPPGISKARILYTMGKQAMHLGAFKLARFAFEKLQHLILPKRWMDQVEFYIMTLQTKPFIDKEELLPIDYRSSSTNPLLNTTGTGDCCINTKTPFVRSFATFDILPLVEFQPMDDISDEEAEKLIKTLPSTNKSPNPANDHDEWKERDHGGGVQTLQLNDAIHEDSMPDEDLFSRLCTKQLHPGGLKAPFVPVVVDTKTLLSLNPSEVFIVRYPSEVVRNQYYKNVIPDISIYYSPTCRHFFHQDDFDFEYLKNESKCPYSRVSLENTEENNKHP